MYAFFQLQGLSNSTEKLFDWSFCLVTAKQQTRAAKLHFNSLLIKL
jgi:hypothetical protein